MRSKEGNKKRETYITKMPDKAGAFLKASEVISTNGGNIVRVSYNKAVDAHTLFIEVEADCCVIDKITHELKELGYLSGIEQNSKVIIVEFKLRDIPGAVKPVLETLQRYDVNISYINSQENGSDYQYFKMGLLIENVQTVKELLDAVSEFCDVRILDYDTTERPLDNTVFYLGFANEMRELLFLTQEQTNEVIIHSNRIMQLLDEKKETPFKTFEYIHKFAKFVTDHKGDNYRAIVNSKRISDLVNIHIIQPPCGSNTYILESPEELLFVDCGFACYKDEMMEVIQELIPNFHSLRKSIIITHGDIDHTGLLTMFDRVYLSKSCYENFELENMGLDNFREQNILHSPYCSLSKIITGYTPPQLDKMCVIGAKDDDATLTKIGEISFYGTKMDIYEGIGGHVRGESVIICEREKVIFTGDCLVNIGGFSNEQKAFNLLAPYLMQSVNVDSAKAKLCRERLIQISKGYLVCPGHGEWYINN